jgi:hypothetical protein
MGLHAAYPRTQTMAPNKLINKSRGVGSKKRTPAKPPKTPAKAPKTPETDLTPTSTLAPTSTPTQKLQDSSPVTVASPLPSIQSYTGLTQVPHGLNIPSFDPNTYFAGDLFANSSSLARNLERGCR